MRMQASNGITGDRRAYFPLYCYAMMTENMLEAIDATRFQDGLSG